MTDALPLPVVRTVSALRAHVRVWRERGQTIAFVPTMGALHDGHLSLVKLGRMQADRVVASVFVNPRQFGPDEDFDRYPRDELKDAGLLGAAQCDLMYAPSVGEMYPPAAQTAVTVPKLSGVLDGAARPGHFDGVATVVTKLLVQVAPDLAIFGEKDFQQLLIVKRLVADLDLGIDVMGAPIARAPDGLALSSRNVYLSEAEREIAPRLYAVLTAGAQALRAGAAVAEVEAEGTQSLLAAGFDKVDYVATHSPEDLSRRGPGPLEGQPARLLAAAWLGRTRLIDNLAV